MTETGFRYAVGALRKKRADLAGEIGTLSLQLRDRRRDLAKVDDMLRMLAPGSDPAKIPPRKPIKNLNLFRQGELAMVIIGVIRSGGRPMSNLEISRAVFDRGGFGLSLWSPIRRRVRANLAYLEAKGRTIKAGEGKDALWGL